MFDIQLKHGSCIIKMKLLLQSKPILSPSQLDSNVIEGSDRLSL